MLITVVVILASTSLEGKIGFHHLTVYDMQRPPFTQNSIDIRFDAPDYYFFQNNLSHGRQTFYENIHKTILEAMRYSCYNYITTVTSCQ